MSVCVSLAKGMTESMMMSYYGPSVPPPDQHSKSNSISVLTIMTFCNKLVIIKIPQNDKILISNTPLYIIEFWPICNNDYEYEFCRT